MHQAIIGESGSEQWGWEKWLFSVPAGVGKGGIIKWVTLQLR